MARYSSGMSASIVGTSVRPIFALLQTASVTGVLRKVALLNKEATAVTYRLVNLTGGTAGATQTARRHRRNAPAASCVPKAGWTADATIGEDTGYRFVLGAAVGAGAIETFGDTGVEGELGATSALGLVLVTGSPSVGPEIYIEWDE